MEELLLRQARKSITAGGCNAANGQAAQSMKTPEKLSA